MTANATLAAGAYTTSIAVADVAGNSAVVAGPAVTVDNTSPTGNSVQTVNGGAIRGRPDSGDVVTFGWTEALDPSSVLAGWTGAATAVQVTIVDSGSSDDTLVVHTSSGVIILPLGSTDLNNNFVSAQTTFNATMVQTGTSIALTLGTLVSGSPQTDTSKAAVVWSPATFAGATDRAGNSLVATLVGESGTADIDF